MEEWYNLNIMALNGKIIQRVTGVKSSDVMHSSGYARTQNAGNFGSATTETFAERQEVEKNRELIQGYKHAQVAQRKNLMPKARTYEQELADKRNRGYNNQDEQNRQKYNSRLERGGLRSFEERRFGDSAMNTNGLAQKQSYAGQKQERTAIGAARSSEARQAMAQRFSGTAKPAPKTGGFAPKFGRH